MRYKILIIDDDEPMHIMARKLLGEEFELIHAKDAQEGIDILSESSVNLILSDIHMPGISGLEFLESLMQDADKKSIPVLVITNLPTVEKEKKALQLGAADFIEKTMFVENREEVLKRVRMKLVTNVDLPNISEDLAVNKKRMVAKLMQEAIRGDFNTTAHILCEELEELFEIDSVIFWGLTEENPRLLLSEGEALPPDDIKSGALKEEQAYQELLKNRQAYMTNHVYNEGEGLMTEFSKRHELPAEIGVPMFQLDERRLLMNNMQIPEDAHMFALMVLKRNKLYSSKEFEVISRLLTQTGSIFWRLYNN